MNEKKEAGDGVFSRMGKKLDRLASKMQEKMEGLATPENREKVNSTLRNAGGRVQESLSRVADKAGEIWKDPKEKIKGWRQEHEGEIKDLTTKADSWVRDQKGNVRGALDRMLEKIQKRLQKP